MEKDIKNNYHEEIKPNEESFNENQIVYIDNKENIENDNNEKNEEI